MRMYDLIELKKRGNKLSKEQIEFIVNGFTNGDIPDYQMSAFLMAVYFQGMDDEETCELTLAMAHSGDMLKFSAIEGKKVDKHSTGGVGDKTTLIVGPLVASLGIPVAKMSGRGLGHTGGTIDKLESIEGFNTSISEEQFIKNVNEINIAVAGQTANLAPADKKIYALRDVTATVDNISLIAASIMSKKLASGADAIVLDVKCGNGAFMKTEEDAVKLAEAMVRIGNMAGKPTVAVITDMNEPLGYKVGNALEVEEAVQLLKGDKNAPEDLKEVCIELAVRMYMASGKMTDFENAMKIVTEKLESGEAFEKFCQMVEAQGGNSECIRNTDLLPKAKIIEPVRYNGESGFVELIDTEDIGKAALVLGGGRETKESVIDLSVGINLLKKSYDKVENSDIIAYVHGNDIKKVELAKKIILESYHINCSEINIFKADNSIEYNSKEDNLSENSFIKNGEYVLKKVKRIIK